MDVGLLYMPDQLRVDMVTVGAALRQVHDNPDVEAHPL